MSLSQARSAAAFSGRLQTIVRSRLLIVDEVGFVPLDAFEASLLFEVMCRSYERGPSKHNISLVNIYERLWHAEHTHRRLSDTRDLLTGLRPR